MRSRRKSSRLCRRARRSCDRGRRDAARSSLEQWRGPSLPMRRSARRRPHAELYFVTDIVRRSDEFVMLRTAFDNVEQGVILLDTELNAQLMNRAARRLWGVSDEQAERQPPYAELVSDARTTGAYRVAGQELEALIALRIAHVRAGSPGPMDLRMSDGRVIRCAMQRASQWRPHVDLWRRHGSRASCRRT